MPELKDKVGVRARVTVTLEIEVPDRWALDCALEQIYTQARRSAVEAVVNIPKMCGGVRIVGETVVTAILIDKAV